MIPQSVIDRHGSVVPIRILKGLPVGLTDEALRAMAAWEYAPARLGGDAVEVYQHLTIRFQIQ